MKGLLSRSRNSLAAMGLMIIQQRRTATQLFAGVAPSGDEACFFCGGQCGVEYTAKEFVKDSFTERDQVFCGGSEFVCGGCVAAMDEKADITLMDGERRSGQKTRNYSWVFTEKIRLAATKAHREQIADACLNPPEPPFAICIADGQKHQLWRTPVSSSQSVVSLNLEGVQVVYSPDDLRERLVSVKQIIACAGKTAVTSAEPSRRLWQRLAMRLPPQRVHELCAWWDRVRLDPLTRLTVWIAPGKDECGHDIKTERATD